MYMSRNFYSDSNDIQECPIWYQQIYSQPFNLPNDCYPVSYCTITTQMSSAKTDKTETKSLNHSTQNSNKQSTQTISASAELMEFFLMGKSEGTVVELYHFCEFTFDAIIFNIIVYCKAIEAGNYWKMKISALYSKLPLYIVRSTFLTVCFVKFYLAMTPEQQHTKHVHLMKELYGENYWRQLRKSEIVMDAEFFTDKEKIQIAKKKIPFWPAEPCQF
ncbi:hypothetical protein RFI_07895 [Reticulomyxa filosa]|uniref:Uncharacterized protein n=1 Tax=Reticulomyxa filosa TaxID=46433 RepID=X6NT91_RETFI|nr:hypothetical protein RFI_07895 [Reticulomyxa filosa]|eukprot:ETO29226.1 hypothetical protein RFI_07895 [Reticulomyxa filosa]